MHIMYHYAVTYLCHAQHRLNDPGATLYANPPHRSYLSVACPILTGAGRSVQLSAYRKFVQVGQPISSTKVTLSCVPLNSQAHPYGNMNHKV